MKVIEKSSLTPRRDPERAYLVLDLCPGGDLFWLAHGQPCGRLPEHAARYYAAEAILALADLHSRGVVHRDVKPENLMLDGEGHVRVGDFGVAARLRAESAAEAPSVRGLSGTINFMPPEVFVRARKHDRMADLYALGVTVHQLLCGTRPYPSDRQSIQTLVRMRSFIPAKSVRDRTTAQRVLARAQRKRWRAQGVVLGCTLDPPPGAESGDVSEDRRRKGDREEMKQVVSEPGMGKDTHGGRLAATAANDALQSESRQKSSRPGAGREHHYSVEASVAHRHGLHPSRSASSIPAPPSRQALDFVEKLLICNEHWRLGGTGVHEVMQHPWFEGVDWQAMRARLLPPPWVPCPGGTATVDHIRAKRPPHIPLQPGLRKTQSQYEKPLVSMRSAGRGLQRKGSVPGVSRAGVSAEGGISFAPKEAGAVGRAVAFRRGLSSTSTDASVQGRASSQVSSGSSGQRRGWRHELGGRELTREAQGIRAGGVLRRAAQRAGARTLSHMLVLAREAQRALERGAGQVPMVVTGVEQTSSQIFGLGDRRARGDGEPGRGDGLETSQGVVHQSASIDVSHSLLEGGADEDSNSSRGGDAGARTDEGPDAGAVAFIEGFDFRVGDSRAAEEGTSLRVRLQGLHPSGVDADSAPSSSKIACGSEPQARTMIDHRGAPAHARGVTQGQQQQGKQEKTQLSVETGPSGGSRPATAPEVIDMPDVVAPEGTASPGRVKLAAGSRAGAGRQVTCTNGSSPYRLVPAEASAWDSDSGDGGDSSDGVQPGVQGQSEGVQRDLGTIQEAADSEAETSVHSGWSGSRGGSMASMAVYPTVGSPGASDSRHRSSRRQRRGRRRRKRAQRKLGGVSGKYICGEGSSEGNDGSKGDSQGQSGSKGSRSREATGADAGGLLLRSTGTGSASGTNRTRASTPGSSVELGEDATGDRRTGLRAVSGRPGSEGGMDGSGSHCRWTQRAGVADGRQGGELRGPTEAPPSVGEDALPPRVYGGGDRGGSSRGASSGGSLLVERMVEQGVGGAMGGEGADVPATPLLRAAGTKQPPWGSYGGGAAGEQGVEGQAAEAAQGSDASVTGSSSKESSKGSDRSQSVLPGGVSARRS